MKTTATITTRATMKKIKKTIRLVTFDFVNLKRSLLNTYKFYLP